MKLQTRDGHSISIRSILGIVALVCLIISCDYINRPTKILFDDLKSLQSPSFFSVSPDGQKVAFALGDTLFVKMIGDENRTWSISSGMKEEATNANMFLAWSNRSSHFIYRRNGVELLISNVDGTEQTSISGGEGESRLVTLQNFFMEGAKWSPDDRYITFPAQPHAIQSTAQLWFYDTQRETLNPKTIEENMIVSHEWIDEDHVVYGLGNFSGNNGAIKSLEISTGSLNVLTQGEESIFNELLYSNESGFLFANSSSFTPYVFKKIDKGNFEKIDNSLPRAYYKSWSADGTWLMGQYSVGMDYLPFKAVLNSEEKSPIFSERGTLLPKQIQQIENTDFVYYTRESGTLPKSIFRAEISQNGDSLFNETYVVKSGENFEGKILPYVEIVSWEQDSKTINAQLFLPAQKEGQVPLILIPYANAYRNRFPNMNYFLEKGIFLLTSEGFAVALANNSGGTNRRRLDKEYGPLELRDALGFLSRVGNHPRIDTSKVGLMGHSHGATMIAYFLTHSERFKAAVAVNGAYDWKMQANDYPGRMYGFPFGMGGTPEELPEKYASFSPMENKDSMDAKLILVAGKKDTQIPHQHAELFYEALKNTNKPVDILLFEDEGHHIEKEENQRVFWERAISHLKGDL